MKPLLTFVSIIFSFFTAFSQPTFDSNTVASKVMDYLSSRSSIIPPGLKQKNVSPKIEQRLNLSTEGFDFSKAENPEYILQKSQKVMVVKFEDIKHFGRDIYIQNESTKYPLTNMEIHADASGKIVKDLPYQEMQSALKLIQSNNLVSFSQAEDIYKKNAQSGKDFSYANLLIDLPTQTVKWQFRGKPNWQNKTQEFMEINAESGKIISDDMKPVNVTTQTNN
jgi:hypothetical protein